MSVMRMPEEPTDDVYPLDVEALERAMRYLASRNFFLWYEDGCGIGAESRTEAGWVFTVGGRRDATPTHRRATVSEAAMHKLSELENCAHGRLAARRRDAEQDEAEVQRIKAVRHG